MDAADLHHVARSLRRIALDATGNTGDDRINAGELAVFEDITRFPGSSIRDITERTGLAQSLVSRIVHAAAAENALTVLPDPHDRRRVRVELTASTAEAISHRAGLPVDAALASHTPQLTTDERQRLSQHLTAISDLLRPGGDAARRHRPMSR